MALFYLPVVSLLFILFDSRSRSDLPFRRIPAVPVHIIGKYKEWSDYMTKEQTMTTFEIYEKSLDSHGTQT